VARDTLLMDEGSQHGSPRGVTDRPRPADTSCLPHLRRFAIRQACLLFQQARFILRRILEPIYKEEFGLIAEVAPRWHA
jgi:hypothetical protein